MIPWYALNVSRASIASLHTSEEIHTLHGVVVQLTRCSRSSVRAGATEQSLPVWAKIRDGVGDGDSNDTLFLYYDTYVFTANFCLRTSACCIVLCCVCLFVCLLCCAMLFVMLRRPTAYELEKQ